MSLLRLLRSVASQTTLPHEIIVVDGSLDNATKEVLKTVHFEGLQYVKVAPQDRGLTKQRNVGIQKTKDSTDIVSFLDDDIVLESNYFEEIIKTFNEDEEVIGVAGYIKNEVEWKEEPLGDLSETYWMDGWSRKLGKRMSLRKKLGLLGNSLPGIWPEHGHGLSQSFLPPTGKKYTVEFLMGGIANYRKSIFQTIQFLHFFEGYGLYEDMDFSTRASRLGKLVICTSAGLAHLHEPLGRPNYFRYGKMVSRNGWYVWRGKFPKPSFMSIVRWWQISLLLALIRAFGNGITQAGLTEAMGRIYGLLILLIKKPKRI